MMTHAILHPPSRNRKRAKRQRDAVILTAMLLITVPIVLQLTGLPPPLRDAALRRLNRDRQYIIQVKSIRFRFPSGITLNRPQVYRRGIIGPPVIEAERIGLRFRPSQWRHRRSGITRISIERGVVRRPAPLTEIDPDYAPWRLPEGDEGRIEFRHIDITGLYLAHGSADYRVDGKQLWLDNIQAAPELSGSPESVRGNGVLHLAERRYRGQAQGRFDPRRLMPVFKVWNIDADHLLSAIDPDANPPTAQIGFSGLLGAPEYTFEGSGKIKAGRFRYRNVPLDALVIDFSARYDRRSVEIDIRQATAAIPHGIMAGAANFNVRKGTAVVDVTGRTSPLTPMTLAGLRIPDVLQEARFDGDSQWVVQGLLDFRNRPGNTALRMHYKGDMVGFRDFTANELETTANFDGRTLEFEEIEAAMLNGTLRAMVSIDTDSEKATPYRFDLKMADIDFKQLIDTATSTRNPDFYEGYLTASAKGLGTVVDDWLATVQASGNLHIRKGRIFRLPLFGGLSQILSRIIPGLDIVLMQTSARIAFTIDDNRLTVTDGRIEGDVFNVEGRGIYVFDENLDFQVQLKLMKSQTVLGTAVRVITFPISKLFEFRLRGTLEKPRWYPVNFSSDLLERLRGIIDFP